MRTSTDRNDYELFNKSRKCYDSSKIREVLKIKDLVVSRREIMKINGLISFYNKDRYKYKKQSYKE